MEKQLKLSLFSDTVFDINGVSRFIQDLAKEALRRNKILKVFTATPLTPPEDAEGITVIDHWAAMPIPHYPGQYFAFPSLWQMKHHFKTDRPDVVHISTPGPVGWNAMRYARKHGCPVTSTYHTNFPQYAKDVSHNWLFYRITLSIMRGFYKRCDLVFTRSLEYVKILEEEVQIPREKIIYLYPGINTERFSPSFRNETLWEAYPQIDPDSVKLLFVGRLSEEKNFPFLLEVFERFQEKRDPADPKVELIALGEGVFLKDVEAWREKGVHLLGIKRGEELSRFYAGCDLFVFPSVTETLGQAVMEAQASGLPAIVSNEGGPRSLVAHDESGYVLPVDDPETWVEAVESLCHNPSLIDTMRQTAHARMQKMSFSKSFETFWNAHAEHYGFEKTEGASTPSTA